MRNVVVGMLLSLMPGMSQAAGGRQGLGLPAVVSCPLGSVTTSFSPGLRQQSQDVTVATQSAFNSCLTVLGEPVVWATAIEHTSRKDQGCGLLRTGLSSETTLRWNTGETSELTFSLYAVDVQGLLTVETYNGVVTEGKYAGATAVRTITYVNTDFIGGCLSVEGLTQAHGISNLVLTLL
ncbi:hypothetical protein [Melittangium boletus]|uniref:hypothetical protein n=1 Tax=Melittangium boletus TaxID=83453 RepID=UPI003DA5E3DE